MTSPNILVLYKKSTFQYYQEIPEDSRPHSDEVNRFKKTHQAHYETLDCVERVLKKFQLSYTKAERAVIADYDAFDAVITVGGDGTFLEGARYVKDQVMLGVNSDPDWSVGRLCFATANDFETYLKDLLSEDFRPVCLNRMKVRFLKSGTQIYFINDVLIAHANPASLSRYILCVEGKSEEQRGSGVWISTAAGSTGAIQSAGGTELVLSSQDFQYRPRELYRGWKKGNYQLTGATVGKGTVVEVTSLMEEGIVFVDGSHQRVSFATSEHIVISQAEQPLQIVAHKGAG